MEQMRFGNKWRRWIKCCLSSSRALVLVNSSPTDEFPISRGVRQGDLLSPFLVILAMEGLNIAIKSACESSLFHGVKLPRDWPFISHMLYTNDAIFAGDWNCESIKNLSRILKCFHIYCDLKVNFFKSLIFRVGTSNAKLCETARVLGCLEGSFPYTFLGVPVVSNMSLKKSGSRFLIDFTLSYRDGKPNHHHLGVVLHSPNMF